MDWVQATPEVIGFVVVVLLLIWADLFMHRKSKEISFASAALWSVGWVCVSMAWYFYLRLRWDAEAANLFLAGYALEQSLSIDNMMIFITIFGSFGIKGSLQHRVLYYGVLGAFLFRFIFVLLGSSLLHVGPYVLFLFAFVVLWAAWQMFRAKEQGEIEDFSGHWSVRWTQKIFPVYPRLVGKRFFLTRAEVEQRMESEPDVKVVPGKGLYATPMLLCLICVEATDVMFAFDSVPAVIAVTREPSLVYSSVIFASLGLRSMYFVLATLKRYIVYLDKAVNLLLVYIGLKLMVEAASEATGLFKVHIPALANVAIVLGILALGVVASLFAPRKPEDTKPEGAAPGGAKPEVPEPEA